MTGEFSVGSEVWSGGSPGDLVRTGGWWWRSCKLGAQFGILDANLCQGG
jgi:hypothetical protein